MRLQLRRNISAWALLAIFVPALLLTSLHRHGDAEDNGCVECVRHQSHAGHIGQQTTCFTDCLMCQFFSLSYLGGSKAPLTLFPILFAVLLFFLQKLVSHDIAEQISPRAPPAISICQSL